MKYVLTDNSRVDFLAHAPLHGFKGWAIKGLQGELEADLAVCTLQGLWATVETCCFDTADPERTTAMSRYFALPEHPRAAFRLSESPGLQPLTNGGWRTKMLGVLDFVDIRRQLPVSGTFKMQGERLLCDLQCKWSFKAYGIKAPRLLMLTVRDIVDIKAHLEFIPQETKDENDVHP